MRGPREGGEVALPGMVRVMTGDALLCCAIGLLHQYAKSGFAKKPGEGYAGAEAGAGRRASADVCALSR